MIILKLNVICMCLYLHRCACAVSDQGTRNIAEGIKGSLEQINEVLANCFVNIQEEKYEIFAVTTR